MGQKHCAFLTVHGQVYMYGNNNSGQLGHGGFDNQYVEPVFVKELCGKYLNTNRSIVQLYTKNINE